MSTHNIYLLDTCICIALLKKNPSVIQRLSMDMFIAATALEENVTLVTGNVKHFERIHGLKIENWMDQ